MTDLEQAQHHLAMKINSMISDLDDFCIMAAKPETVGLIEAEQIAFGQMLLRVQLIASFLNARKPQSLKVVRHG